MVIKYYQNNTYNYIDNITEISIEHLAEAKIMKLIDIGEHKIEFHKKNETISCLDCLRKAVLDRIEGALLINCINEDVSSMKMTIVDIYRQDEICTILSNEKIYIYNDNMILIEEI